MRPGRWRPPQGGRGSPAARRGSRARHGRPGRGAGAACRGRRARRRRGRSSAAGRDAWVVSVAVELDPVDDTVGAPRSSMRRRSSRSVPARAASAAVIDAGSTTTRRSMASTPAAVTRVPPSFTVGRRHARKARVTVPSTQAVEQGRGEAAPAGRAQKASLSSRSSGSPSTMSKRSLQSGQR